MNYLKQKKKRIYGWYTIIFIISIHTCKIPSFLKTFLCLNYSGYRERPLSDKPDDISHYFWVISCLYAHMKACLLTECVNASSMYSRMKVTLLFAITCRLLMLCFMQIFHRDTVSTGIIMIRVFHLCGLYLFHLFVFKDVMGNVFCMCIFCIFTPPLFSLRVFTM